MESYPKLVDTRGIVRNTRELQENMKSMSQRTKKRNIDRNDDRGQVTLDYLAGITIFLFAIFFVFQYTSGMFTPFQSNSDEITLVADRTSIILVENVMSAGDSSTPNFVDEAKVDSFFTKLGTDYSETIESLGLNGTYYDYDLNVTLENETSGIIYSQGMPLSATENIGQTKRVVLLKYEDTSNTEIALLSVRVW